jgi:LysR family transcriptional regulator, regulator for bpeEF and oprC
MPSRPQTSDITLSHVAGVLAFVRVAETGSFSDAARALGLSPSAVSKSVARLEVKLSAKLLHRTTRSVSLTSTGESLFPAWQRALQDLQNVEAGLRATQPEPSGRLRVDMSPVFGRLFLIPLLPAFLERYPKLVVELSFDDRMVDLAEEGVDVVVRVGELPSSAGLIVRHLFTRQMVVCGAPAYLRKHGRPRTLEELKHHNCLLFRNPATGRFYAWRFKGKDKRDITMDVPSNFIADDGEAVFDAALAGIGLTQTPTYMAAPHLESGRLERVLKEYPGHSQTYSACYRERRLVAPKIRAFVDFLAASSAHVS